MRFPRFIAALLLLLAPAALAETVVVSEADMHGWAFLVTSDDGVAEFQEGPASPPLGNGSVYLFTGTHGDESAQVRNANYHFVRLDSLTSLGYWTYAIQWNGGQVPYIMLNLDIDGDSSLDDILFFEPEYQSGYRFDIPDQGPNELNVWQDWDAIVGGWWSLNGYGGAGPGGDVKTLEEYLDAVPDARIINSASGLGGLRIVSGFASPTDVFEANTDAVTVGVAGDEVTYDFEALFEVVIDLKPRSTDNRVNTQSRALVPVAILGSATFAPASEVDYASVEAEGAPAVETKFDVGDVNGDGFADLTLYFRARDMDKPTEAECDDPAAILTLTGFLLSGTPISGQDNVDWTGPDCN